MMRRNDTSIGLAIAHAQRDPCWESITVAQDGHPRFVVLWVWDMDSLEWATPVRVDRGEIA